MEFSRVGDGGELATAICIDAPLSDFCWTLLAASSLQQAVQALREREQIPATRDDGVGTLLPRKHVVGSLSKWAVSKGLDAVIWTALPPRYEGIENRIPSLDDVLAYLESLTGEVREHAKSYIEQVPAQIDTPYRRAFKQLDW